jgi:hypothetical protein
MEMEKLAGYIAVAWLIGAMLLLMRLVRRGRQLAADLAARHPETYEALGRPQPGFLHSVRRSQFARFVARREYENLGDSVLSAEFEDYRQAEARLLIVLLASLGVVGFLILAVLYVV